MQNKAVMKILARREFKSHFWKRVKKDEEKLEKLRDKIQRYKDDN